MLALAGLHFWKRGPNRRFKAGGASSRGDPSLVVRPPRPPGCRRAALEPRAQSTLTPVPNPPHSGPRLDPSLALGKEGWGDIKPTQRPARSRPPGSGSQWTCLAGAPPGLGGGHLGEVVEPASASHLSLVSMASLRPGSPGLRRLINSALALTLAVTSPGPWQLPVDPTAAKPTQPQAVPLPG